MSTQINTPIWELARLKKVLTILFTAYVIMVTIFALRSRPQTTLIAIGSEGTRIITERDDQGLAAERLVFVKRFLWLLYNFDSENFERQISMAGDLMNESLWSEKSAEFKAIQEKAKSETILQDAILIELSETQKNAFTASLKIRVMRKLVESMLTLKVSLIIEPKSRTHENPYPFEVVRYEESLIK